MKNILFIVAFLYITVTKAQSYKTDSCHYTMPNDTVVCPGDTLRMYMADAANYQWKGNGFVFTNHFTSIDTSKFKVVFNWHSTMTLTAMFDSCFVVKVINIRMCTEVGIKENAPAQTNESAQIPIYFDLYGRQIEKLYNQVIIEQKGTRRRKMIIQP